MFLPIKQKPCSQKGYKVLRKHVMKKVDGYNLATFWPLKRREPAPRAGSYYGGEGSMDMSDSTGSRSQLDGTCPCRARSASLPARGLNPCPKSDTLSIRHPSSIHVQREGSRPGDRDPSLCMEANRGVPNPQFTRVRCWVVQPLWH